jgi:predicted nucleotidyltransferase
MSFGDVRTVSHSLEQRMSKDTPIAVCKRNHIRKLSVFGSAIRGELGPQSNIDLLVEFEPDHIPGLFSVGRMEMGLSETLGRKVDLRTPEDLSQYFCDEVMANAELQYQS